MYIFNDKSHLNCNEYKIHDSSEIIHILKPQIYLQTILLSENRWFKYQKLQPPLALSVEEFYKIDVLENSEINELYTP